MAALYSGDIAAGQSRVLRLRLSNQTLSSAFKEFERIFENRRVEADEFYTAIQNPNLSTDEKRIQRQALAGMLWSKQFYYYDIEQWINGDPAMKPLPDARRKGRNHEWEHLNNFDIISMPDKWEYPWYAARHSSRAQIPA